MPPEVIMVIKRHISKLKKRYIRYSEMMYNYFLSITKFVLLTIKIQLEHLFNLFLK